MAICLLIDGFFYCNNSKATYINPLHDYNLLILFIKVILFQIIDNKMYCFKLIIVNNIYHFYKFQNYD